MSKKIHMMWFVGATTATLLCVAIFLYDIDDSPPFPKAQNQHTDPDVESSTVNEIEDRVTEFRAADVSKKPRKVDFESLRIACPDMRVVMSDECFASLDEYFMTLPLPDVRNIRDKLLHVGSQPTFGRIFADPIADRKNAIAALNEETCRLERGSVRTELETECHATAIANHALFNRYCSSMQGTFHRDWFESELRFEGASFYQHSLSQLDSLHWENLDDYRASIQDLDEAMYRHAWLHQKCSHFGSEVRKPLRVWPDIHQLTVSRASERYGTDQTLWSDDATLDVEFLEIDDEYLRLVAVSARLGDEWAMVKHYLSKPEDSDFNNSIRELRPWLPPLRETIRIRIPRVQLLTNAIAAVRLAELEGVTINQEFLVRTICDERENKIDCETAFSWLFAEMELSPHSQRIADDLRKIYAEMEPESKCFNEHGEEVECGW